MKKLNQMNLDIYLYIKDYINKNGYCPSYRDIQENSNYKSLSSVKEAIEKLADIKFLKVVRNENGNILSRTIKAIDNNYTRECIKELREEYEQSTK